MEELLRRLTKPKPQPEPKIPRKDIVDSIQLLHMVPTLADICIEIAYEDDRAQASSVEVQTNEAQINSDLSPINDETNQAQINSDLSPIHDEGEAMISEPSAAACNVLPVNENLCEEVDDGAAKEEPVLTTLNPLPVTPASEEDYDIFDPGFECIKRKANMSTSSAAPWCENSQNPCSPVDQSRPYTTCEVMQKLRKNRIRPGKGLRDAKSVSLYFTSMCYHSTKVNGILTPCDVCIAERNNMLWNKKIFISESDLKEGSYPSEIVPDPLPIHRVNYGRNRIYARNRNAFPIGLPVGRIAGLLRKMNNGSKEHQKKKFLIIDCRYPYEYQGGHIQGAVNVYMRSAMLQVLFKDGGPTKPNTMLIFHCEFSSHRAPTLCRFLREADYDLNNWTGSLHYPEVYLITGGYKNFFNVFPYFCTPISYTSMWDTEFASLRGFYSKLKGSDLDSIQKVGLRNTLDKMDSFYSAEAEEEMS